jgi:ribose transport system substrate-binding protein
MVLTAVLVMGCGSNDSDNSSSGTNTESESGDSGEKKTYKFGFTEWAAGSFFDACYDGVMSVVHEQGGEVIRIEGKTDSNVQLGVIEDFISQEVDCVFYNPVDAEAAGPALQLLKDAGIPVVNFDLAVSDTSMVDAFVATDHYSAGTVAGDQMLKDYPEGGDIAILDRTNDNAAAQRVQGLLDTVGDKFKVVSRLDGGGKPETGLSITEDILQANPNIVAIYCINDECAQGAYSAIQAENAKIGIYSANGGPESKAAISRDGKEGNWKCTAAQSPFTVGKQSAEIAYQILAGESYEKEILIPTFAINADNISEYAGSDWQ